MKLPAPHFRTVLLLCLFVLSGLTFCSSAAGAGITGRVINGTTNRSVSNQKVLLLTPKPGQGMTLVAETTTGADGRFAFAESDVGQTGFYLVQVNAGDIPYHFPVQFDSSGGANVDATVYDEARDPSVLRVKLLHILVRAEGDRAQVQELFRIENTSRPPRAYNDVKGTFQFALPAEVREPSAAVTGLLNMQLPETPTPGEKPGEFVLHYPFKPGPTQVTVGYEADYTQHELAFAGSVPYPVDRAELYVMPASLQVDSSVFKLAGSDAQQNVQQLVAENLTRDETLSARLSGEALSATEAPSDESQVKTEPTSISRLGVPILFCFLLLLLWALGIRLGKEWPRLKAQRPGSPVRRQFEAKAEELLNSLADLDELFDSGKVEKKKYWKERLELKARLAALLKKAPATLPEPYAAGRKSRQA